MDLDFDKEMDILLRNALRQNGSPAPVTAPSSHLDADALAAFAENALPQTARVQYLSHLADCDSCREILSSLILLNEDEETVVAAEITETHAPRLTWGERIARLFALPNLGYAVAALAVMFIGTFAFVSLYNQQQKNVATVTTEEFSPVEISEKRPSAAPAPPERREEEVAVAQEVPTPDALANANKAATPEQQSTPNLNADNLPPSVRATTGATSNRIAPAETTLARNQANNNTVANNNTAVAQPPAPVVAATAPPKQENKVENSERVARSEANELTQGEENRESEKDLASAPTDAADADLRARSARPASAAPRVAKKIAVPAVTRTVGGKTFQKINGVWTDSAYSSQSSISISRGSDAYKNLDASLRSIANSFGGETVIIISQGKAYRIR